MKRPGYLTILLILVIIFVCSCNKEDESFKNPYLGGKQPLGIAINTEVYPVPAEGLPGTTVTIIAKGLLDYKDKFDFFFNGVKADIIEVDSNSIRVKIPEFASTGITSIQVGNQIFFGPAFTVEGDINIDPTFKGTGANGMINQALELPNGHFLLVGPFSDYNNFSLFRPIQGIAAIDADGGVLKTFAFGGGPSGTIRSICATSDGKFMIAGNLSGFNAEGNISNITRLKGDGSVENAHYITFSKQDKRFPAFNGGVAGGYIGRVYEYGDKILISGNFKHYVTRHYDQPSRAHFDDTIKNHQDSIVIDSIEVQQLLRMNTDGSLDTTYRFNVATQKGIKNANGDIDTYMHSYGDNKGKLLVYGGFTEFGNTPFGHIVRLLPDGTIDPGFNSGGVGADDYINSATYNDTAKQYLITGSFRHYNGKPVGGIALLNKDGTLSASFSPKIIWGGAIQFAKQLDDGLIVASGNFRSYDGVYRNGFMILTATGGFAPGYNATGNFNGLLTDAIETKSADGRRALLLIGLFNIFNSKPASNIIRITME